MSSNIQLLDTLLVWLHICIVLDINTSRVKLYLNEIVEEIDLQIQNNEPIEIQTGGKITLGVEQNVVLGGFTLE